MLSFTLDANLVKLFHCLLPIPKTVLAVSGFFLNLYLKRGLACHHHHSYVRIEVNMQEFKYTVLLLFSGKIFLILNDLLVSKLVNVN